MDVERTTDDYLLDRTPLHTQLSAPKDSIVHSSCGTSQTWIVPVFRFTSRARNVMSILTLNSLSRIMSRLGQVEELVCFTDGILQTVRDPTSLSAQR